MKHFCPCCGYQTLDSKHEYDICSICYWEDDKLQYDNIFCTGANQVNLIIAKQNYSTIGVADSDFMKYGTSPNNNLKKNPLYKTWENLLFENLNKLHKILNEGLDDIDNFDFEQNLILYLDYVCIEDEDFFYSYGKKFLQTEQTQIFWEKVAAKYFTIFDDYKTVEFKNQLIEKYGCNFDSFKRLLESL